MVKTIIAGAAVLLLSAGAAVAQSNSDQNSMGAGTSRISGHAVEWRYRDCACTQKARSIAVHYPKGEAKLNREEAQQTKQLNIQESQEVASSSGSSSQPQ